MKKLWFILYNIIVIPVLFLSVHIAAFFNQKFKKAIRGRKRIFEELILNALSLDKTKRLIWFHSSSLGEFEQAKPIIEELKKDNSINILITFFSPSGYENSKKYPFADLVSYLPFDSWSMAKRFIQIVRPDLALMMRYDIWPNHIWAMKKFGIPCYLVDATMKKNSPRKVPVIKNFHKHLFKDIAGILAVTQADINGFREFGCTDEQLKAVGDTRFDRVHSRSLLAKEKNLVRENVFRNKKIFVAGSTWNADEEIIVPVFSKLAKYDKDLILVVAPHEPTVTNLERLENEFRNSIKSIRFSHMNHYSGERIIIIDSIGILLTLYIYAHVAFVGGGFKQNIHNVLEAAVYGIPVLFGPRIENSQEAQQLLRLGGGILVKNKQEAYRNLRLLFKDEKLRKIKGGINYNYVHENLGATGKIIAEIYRVIR
jgi:3-deoxy-D-manno-octulosonic-acid transferase